MNNHTLIALKIDENDLDVEYEILSPLDISSNDRYSNLNLIKNIDHQIENIQEEIDKINAEIDRLTSHADGIDLALAVTCGLITGLIDVFFVGEWNFAEEQAKTYEQVNKKVIAFAKKMGYKGDRLDGAIRFLEKNFLYQVMGATSRICLVTE